MREESGQVLILMTIAMFLILGIAAYAIDAAQLGVAHHQAQVAADAGALAAAQEMENENTPASTVTTEGDSVAGENDPSGNVTISQPDGSDGYTAKAVVSAPVKLTFGSIFGLGNGGVSATATAQVSSTPSPVGDSDITDLGCSLSSKICTCLAGQELTNSDSDAGYWTVTAKAEDPTTANTPSDNGECSGETGSAGMSSVNQQQCDGGLAAAACYDPDSTTAESSKLWVVDLNGESEGGMWQTVTTVPGMRYDLSFWLTGNPGLQGYPNPQSNSFPLDVYITDGTKGSNGTDNPYTPSFTGTDACTNAPAAPGQLACGYWPYSDEVISNVEVADFTDETLEFTAKSDSTTITFNSETYDENAMDGSDGWFFCGPEVTNINLAYAGVVLVQ